MTGPDEALSKRERQVVQTLYRLGEGTVADVQRAMGGELNYNAVRGMLRVLSEKGIVEFRPDGARYVFRPALPKKQAAKSALSGLLSTFFDGSVADVVATLLSEAERDLTPEELDRIAQLIDQAKRSRQ